MRKEGLFLARFFLILFLSLFFISVLSAGELRVTEEHPFLVDGEWISASELKLGDILSTLEGKKVRITSLEDVVDEPFLVYNLEANPYSNFVVRSVDGLGVIVHNSNKIETRCLPGEGEELVCKTTKNFPKPEAEAKVGEIVSPETPAPKFQLIRVIKTSVLSEDDFLKVYQKLDELVLKGAAKRLDIKSNSVYKKVYLVQVSDLDTILKVEKPEIIAKIKARIPADEQLVVVKIPKKQILSANDITEGQGSFFKEVKAERTINKVDNAAGLEDNLVAETVYIRESALDVNRFKELDAIQIARYVPEPTIEDFLVTMGKAVVNPNSAVSSRAMTLIKRITSTYPNTKTKIDSAIRLSGYRIKDFHKNNLVIGFKTPEGIKVSVQDILDPVSGIDPAKVSFYIRAYEVGGSVPMNPGWGSYSTTYSTIIQSGDRGLVELKDTLENIIRTTL